MPITASCGNCGKTYQAPDRMAGKNVRCKACGEVFRIDAPDAPPPAEGELDLDALERSFGGETIGGSMNGTQSAVSVDARGKVKIARTGDPDAFAISGDEGDGMRSNYRYRYPGAKQVDQLLPWALVAITLFVVVQACLTTEANTDARPSTGVGVSRAFILIAAYVALVFPASHLALTMASKKLRFSMPRAPLWRSFAAFTPVLMMGAGLFILSGGGSAGLAMGLFVGITLALGAVALLFRVFPNELPIVGGYAAGGAAVGSFFAVALIAAANVVGVSIARMDKEPTLFTSPIALGMPWVERPTIGPATPVRNLPAAEISGTKTTPTTAADPASNALPRLPGEAEMTSLPVPFVAEGSPAFVRAVDQTPIRPGFDSILTTPVVSNVIAAVRSSGGGLIELWDRQTFQQPNANVGKDFNPAANPLFVNTTGKRVVRLVQDPTDRIEELPLGNQPTIAPVPVIAVAGRTVIGFLNDRDLLVSLRDGAKLSLEQYDLVQRARTIEARQPFRKINTGSTRDSTPLEIEGNSTHTLRVLGDGKSVLLAARDPQSDRAARLFRYDLTSLSVPRVTRDLPLNASTQLAPIGLAASPDTSRAALLLNTGGEGYLTVWNIAPPTPTTTAPTTDPSLIADPTLPLVDRKLGLLSSLQPANWNDMNDPILWIDERTIVLYGKFIHDARTGARLGVTGLNNIVGQVPQLDALGRALFIQSTGGLRTLIRVTFDANALTTARGT